MQGSDIDRAGRPRWHGQPSRLEVHYLTATDERTGTGLWLHHEVVSPTSGEAYSHGWLATFPVEAPPSVGCTAGTQSTLLTVFLLAAPVYAGECEPRAS